jgi:hypothetical protein
VPIIKTIHYLNGRTVRYRTNEHIVGAGVSEAAARERFERIVSTMRIYGVELAGTQEPETWEAVGETSPWRCGWREAVRLQRVAGTAEAIYPNDDPTPSGVYSHATFIRYGLSKRLLMDEVVSVLHALDPSGSYLEPDAIVGDDERSRRATAALDAAAAAAGRR